jgi:hypothetical protein
MDKSFMRRSNSQDLDTLLSVDLSDERPKSRMQKRRTFRDQSAAQRPKSSIGALTLLYQPPIVKALKPRDLTGPFDVTDVPAIRYAFNNRFYNDTKRQRDDILISHQFYRDLNIDNYLSHKTNWQNKSKFQSTVSFCKALDAYLPKYTQTKRILTTKLDKRNPEEN